MAHFILTPVGSSGDVNPFIWLGKHLLARGHEVILIAAPPFQKATEQAGLKFVQIGTREQYYAALKNTDLWHPRKGSKVAFRYSGESILLYFETVRSLIKNPSQTVLVGSSLAFGARLIREKLNIPLATIHLQPSCILSLYDTPIFAQGMEWVSQLPRFLKKIAFSLPNPIETTIWPYLKTACASVGVPFKANSIWDWWHSPDLVLGLFPDWFASPQPDWPSQIRLCSFPLYDLGDQHQDPPELNSFLNQGTKPILFTPGSAMQHAHDFFDTALKACQQMGARAIFVTSHREHLPTSLPATIAHFDYLSFHRVFSKMAAVVHHGGIGTLSQGLAAGVPQLIMPMSHDQPDNANRLERLGTGKSLSPRQFTVRKVTQFLQQLLIDPQIHNQCHEMAKKIRQNQIKNGLAIDLLEKLCHAHQNDK